MKCETPYISLNSDRGNDRVCHSKHSKVGRVMGGGRNKAYLKIEECSLELCVERHIVIDYTRNKRNFRLAPLSMIPCCVLKIGFFSAKFIISQFATLLCHTQIIITTPRLLIRVYWAGLFFLIYGISPHDDY